jgi:L-lactate dehydrogenase (cytochrome)
MGKIFSSEDARRLAKRRLPWMVFDYFDGAAGEAYGEQLNRRTIRAMRLLPSALNNVEERSLGTHVFGEVANLPYGISPMGMCNLATPCADLLLAKVAAEQKIPMGVSTAASTSLERIIEAAEGYAWFQLYYSGNIDQTKLLMDRAKKAGYKTIILTVDVPEVGRRTKELKHGFTMPFKMGVKQLVDFAFHPAWSLATLFSGRPKLANFGGDFGAFDRTASRAGADWDMLDQIRDAWDGNLVIKGVLNPNDALRMKEAGVDAIQVSSHGGRQLDSAPPPIVSLQQIRKIVGKDFPLFFDSGLRSGEDIIKAYACGANYTFLGRPLLFSLAALKEQGLCELIGSINAELSITLAQLGKQSISEINSSVLSSGHR